MEEDDLHGVPPTENEEVPSPHEFKCPVAEEKKRRLEAILRRHISEVEKAEENRRDKIAVAAEKRRGAVTKNTAKTEEKNVASSTTKAPSSYNINVEESQNANTGEVSDDSDGVEEVWNDDEHPNWNAKAKMAAQKATAAADKAENECDDISIGSLSLNLDDLIHDAHQDQVDLTNAADIADEKLNETEKHLNEAAANAKAADLAKNVGLGEEDTKYIPTQKKAEKTSKFSRSVRPTRTKHSYVQHTVATRYRSVRKGEKSSTDLHIDGGGNPSKTSVEQEYTTEKTARAPGGKDEDSKNKQRRVVVKDSIE